METLRLGWGGRHSLCCNLVAVGSRQQVAWDRAARRAPQRKIAAPRDPGKFNVAIAHLDRDDNHQIEGVIRDSLRDKFPIVNTMPFDRLISTEDEREGHERARALLKASGFDVMVWGDYLSDREKDSKSQIRLHLTTSRDETRTSSAGRYRTIDDQNLPPLFWQDLTDVLGLLVATSEAEFEAHEGRYQADKLIPFIKRVRTLLKSSTADQWNAATRANVQIILGNALLRYGEQSGTNEPLREAIAFYGEALKERTREKVPLDWAATQNNLGLALAVLGKRESDPARLTEAVATYREALKEWTREKVPLDWAATQNNLGLALTDLGERESDPARLTEAVAAHREALKEYTREKAPLDWAMTQSNLGNALAALGKRESDPARLTEAVAAHREALKEYTREKVPFAWANTQTNLGAALAALGERESDPAPLMEAVAADREALMVRTREKVPLDWAETQNNLGVALEALGKRESDPARLEEAARAFQAALLEYRAAKADYYTKVDDENLQRVRKEISQQKNAKIEVDSKTR
ncbi:tetratricopeptide (TPR) repeat protein [Paraburkholderia sp. GAS448]|uniref:hypothetical protein n=1 Tax=Paraburkholderia sp. GAS448 TaxID=3035136 RepID=UPI003D1C41FC